MATVKPVYLSTSTGRLTVIQSGDTIDSSVLPVSGGSSGIIARAASTANLTLSAPGATIDGVTMVSGDKVLVKNQTTGSQNGIYVWNGAAAAMTRATDLDSSAEAVTGMMVAVAEGTTNATTLWMLATPQPITLDTTTLIFELISSSETITVATEFTVDFGADPVLAKQFTVSLPGVTVGQRVSCSPSGYTPTGQYFDEYEFTPIFWVAKCITNDQLVILGSSHSGISGQHIVQVVTKVSTTQMFITAGASVTPDFIVQGTNII